MVVVVVVEQLSGEKEDRKRTGPVRKGGHKGISLCIMLTLKVMMGDEQQQQHTHAATSSGEANNEMNA